MNSLYPSGRSIAALLSLTLSLLLPGVCRADGFIVIHNPPPPVVPGHFSFAPLEVAYHHVTVRDQRPGGHHQRRSGVLQPQRRSGWKGRTSSRCPTGSHIDKFSMDINGTMMEAELLPADKARALYEEIVRKAKDPALLEYVGRDAFKVRIFPIEPNCAQAHQDRVHAAAQERHAG